MLNLEGGKHEMSNLNMATGFAAFVKTSSNHL